MQQSTVRTFSSMLADSLGPLWQNTTEIYLFLTFDLHVIAASPKAPSYLHAHLAGKRSLAFHTLISPLDEGACMRALRQITNGEVTHIEGIYRLFDQERYHDICAYLTQDDIGNRLIVLSIRDRHECQKLYDTMQKEAQKFRSLVESSHTSTLLLDVNGFVTYASPNADIRLRDEVAHFGVSNALNHVHEDDHEKILDSIREVFYTQGSVWRVEHRIMIADGSFSWLSADFHPMRNAEGDVISVMGVIQNIDQLRAQQAQILHLSTHDKLTDLYNRAYLDSFFAEQLQPSILPLGILYCDMNGLKITNDAFGHRKGDDLLCRAAKILLKHCPKNGFAIRSGGDEFILLLPNTTQAKTDALRKQIAIDCYEQPPIPIHISLAMGGAVMQRIQEDPQAVLSLAEERMYKAKLRESRQTHERIIGAMRESLLLSTQDNEEELKRIAALCQALGQAAGASKKALSDLSVLCMLHDIGMLSIHEEIRNKNGMLSSRERMEMQRHPEAGYRICLTSPEYAHIADAVLSHHEHYDGSGYPQSLVGEDIPFISRILSLVDAYFAMRAPRLHRHPPLSREEAVQELLRCAGAQFDPSLTCLLVDIIHTQPEDSTLV